jgi:DNA polymerase elongation subunit (family B)
MSKPRILVLDIETRPALGYTFQMYKTNIAQGQLVEPTSTLCVGMKWLGEKEVECPNVWEHGSEGMARIVHERLSEADAVVTYNGDKFDLPKLTDLFIKHDLGLPPPLTSIDLYKTVRNKMGLDFNSLQHVAAYLEVGSKVKHEGFALWRKCVEGDVKAQARMIRYCKGDIRLTERVYKRLRSYIVNHPHLGFVGKTACGACGSHATQSRGYRRTKSFKIQRIQCTECGSWQDGKRQKVT